MPEKVESSKMLNGDMPTTIPSNNHATESSPAPPGLTLFRRKEPGTSIWLPLSAIQTFEDLEKILKDTFPENIRSAAIIYRNESIIPSVVWKHALVDGAVYGLSFKYTNVVIYVYTNSLSYHSYDSEHVFNVSLNSKISHFKRLLRLLFEDMDEDEAYVLRKSNELKLYTQEVRHGARVKMEDECELSAYVSKGSNWLIVIL
ncbi:MAG: hypothetical protein M1812_005982 [Candelaria pacifica]|nr:MAG: hypothetical protein M1812_005982 [Candelaria pacifica]